MIDLMTYPLIIKPAIAGGYDMLAGICLPFSTTGLTGEIGSSFE